MCDERRHQSLQLFAALKYDVGGPFALVAGPIIRRWILGKNLFVDGVQPLREAGEQIHPIGLQLLVHELLRALKIRDPRKAVFLLLKREPRLAHLLRQPFPTVNADLDVEGKPGLNPRVHPPQPLVPSIVIEHMAGPLPPYDLRLHIFERRTRLQHAQHTYWPTTDAPLGSHPPRIFVLVHACLSHVNDRQSSFATGPGGSLLDPLTDLLQVVAVMFERNSILPQEFFHSLGHHHLPGWVPVADIQPARCTSQYQSIEPGQHAHDTIAIFFDKLLHGVLL